MSINTCTMPECLGQVHGEGLCVKHYRRWKRHGNPYSKRKPRCPVCLQAARVFRRPTKTKQDEIEKFTDLFLLFKTGSTYRLTSKDGQGREYELESDLVINRG